MWQTMSDVTGQLMVAVLLHDVTQVQVLLYWCLLCSRARACVTRSAAETPSPLDFTASIAAWPAWAVHCFAWLQPNEGVSHFQRLRENF